MRVDALHRRIIDDVRVMHDAIDHVLPVTMPACYQKRAMNFNAFLKRLNAVTASLNIFSERDDDLVCEVGHVYCSGLWLSEGELPENDSNADVRIIWHAHPDTKRLVMTPPEWQRRRYYFWQLTGHELVHRHQNVFRTNREEELGAREYLPRSNDRKAKAEQSYLGHYDEIEAHAHDAALDLLTFYGHLSFRDAVRETLNYTGKVALTLPFFVGVFADAPGHPALTQFHRKVRAWYEEMKKRPEIYQLLQLPNLMA